MGYLIALGVLGLLGVLMARGLFATRGSEAAPLQGLGAAVEPRRRAPEPSAAELPAAAPAIPARYEHLRELMKRGDGVSVYLALDREQHREVWLKILGAASDNQTRYRFGCEARTLACLNHPYVPSVFECGQHEGGAYLAHEALYGVTLSQAITEGVSLRRSLPVMLQVLEALAFIHRRGIVHRDIKPSGIMIRPDGTVKVWDFWIAQLIDAPLATGVIGGVYISPEQTQTARLDGRSDLFAVGCVLFELITGWRPFRAESLEELFHKIRHEQPDMDLAPEGPAWEPLRSVITRALQKAPEDRYPDALAMHKDLKVALAELGDAAEWFPSPAQTALAKPN